jgi:hypothetical protein
MALAAGGLEFAEPPLHRGDREETPLAGHAVKLVRATLLEFKP